MEEEVNQRVATMIVSTSKMSAGVLARAMQRFLANEHQAINRHAMEKQAAKAQEHGKQIMNALTCSNKTVTRLLNELESVHLISREKSGFSKPDRIYVMNFLAVVYKVHHETCKKYTSGDVESTPRDMYNLHPNNTDNNKTDISDTESIVSISKTRCDAMDEYRSYD